VHQQVQVDCVACIYLSKTKAGRAKIASNLLALLVVVGLYLVLVVEII